MPIHNKASSAFRRKSATNAAYPTSLGTASLVLFPEVPHDSIIERVVHNPSSTASLAVSLCPPSVDPSAPDVTAPGSATPAGQPPAALNTGGSMMIPPLGSLIVEHTGSIQGIASAANSPITCYER